ncbi:MAG TPA: sodium-independent anion transporter [Bordetella sp.]
MRDLIAAVSIAGLLIPEAVAAVLAVLIVRPKAQLFFANADKLLNGVRQLIQQAQPPVRAVMLSREESPDLDGTALEALQTFAAECRARNQRLVLARLKPDALHVLHALSDGGCAGAVLSELSVDESLQPLLAQVSTSAA